MQYIFSKNVYKNVHHLYLRRTNYPDKPKDTQTNLQQAFCDQKITFWESKLLEGLLLEMKVFFRTGLIRSRFLCSCEIFTNSTRMTTSPFQLLALRGDGRDYSLRTNTAYTQHTWRKGTHLLTGCPCHRCDILQHTSHEKNPLRGYQESAFSLKPIKSSRGVPGQIFISQKDK